MASRTNYKTISSIVIVVVVLLWLCGENHNSRVGSSTWPFCSGCKTKKECSICYQAVNDVPQNYNWNCHFHPHHPKCAKKWIEAQHRNRPNVGDPPIEATCPSCQKSFNKNGQKIFDKLNPTKSSSSSPRTQPSFHYRDAHFLPPNMAERELMNFLGNNPRTGSLQGTALRGVQLVEPPGVIWQNGN